VENQILGVVSGLACSPLVSGAALSSMEAFYGTLVTVDNQIAGHVIPSLTVSLERAGKDGSAANVSKCLASIVRCAMSMAAGTIAEFTKHVKVGYLCAIYQTLTIEL
jgi:cullin-associated NEDD8-dissociated protein 1